MHFDAVATDSTGHLRVFQDKASPHILYALLALTPILSCWKWFLMRCSTVPASAPTSIASVAVLLADGNLFDFLPDDAAWLKTHEIALRFGRRTLFHLINIIFKKIYLFRLNLRYCESYFQVSFIRVIAESPLEFDPRHQKIISIRLGRRYESISFKMTH